MSDTLMSEYEPLTPDTIIIAFDATELIERYREPGHGYEYNGSLWRLEAMVLDRLAEVWPYADVLIRYRYLGGEHYKLLYPERDDVVATIVRNVIDGILQRGYWLIERD